jgi:hypothetical protein
MSGRGPSAGAPGGVWPIHRTRGDGSDPDKEVWVAQPASASQAAPSTAHRVTARGPWPLASLRVVAGTAQRAMRARARACSGWSARIVSGFTPR